VDAKTLMESDPFLTSDRVRITLDNSGVFAISVANARGTGVGGANPGRLDPGPKPHAVGLPNTSASVIIGGIPFGTSRAGLLKGLGQ
jgi:hypothetical protein